MTTERDQLKQAIAALDAQRVVLGNAVVETALAPLREKLAALGDSGTLAVRQRKQVTALFADLVSFTSLSEKLDLGQAVARLLATGDSA